MNKEYCDYELAKALKDASYNESCDAYYVPTDNMVSGYLCKGETRNTNKQIAKSCCSAPTIYEAATWFRDEHLIFVSSVKVGIGSDEWGFGYEIEYLPIEKRNDKRRAAHFKVIASFYEYVGGYGGSYHNYEQALHEGLKQAVKLIKEN